MDILLGKQAFPSILTEFGHWQVLAAGLEAESAGVAPGHVGGVPTSHFHERPVGCAVLCGDGGHGSAEIVWGKFDADAFAPFSDN